MDFLHWPLQEGFNFTMAPQREIFSFPIHIAAQQHIHGLRNQKLDPQVSKSTPQ